MNVSLTDQHILVTGGGSGIARAAAERYHREGATVSVVERSAANAQALRDASEGGIRVIVGDAGDPEVLQDAVRQASDSGGRLHNLTCGVGVFDFYTRVHELTAAELMAAAEESWRVNVLSALLAVNVAHPALRAAAGSVTLTLSESAFRPGGGGVLYGSAKWALRGVVEHLAVELAPVRVNGVAPGGTGSTSFSGLTSLGQSETAATVAGRDERIAQGSLLGITPQPSDHAGAYRYLADPVDARAVTGIVVRTDAGHRG